MQTTVQPPLSNMQVELLKLYSAGVPDEYLADIKRIIAKYLFEKARDRADKIWDEKGYSEETLKKWISGNE
ncbi:MAG: hypothetical protein EPO28_08165 [Saprospiraceae bacterium]|nr:MAG: hypothetical protein EPO28_08165 [Saprospiraceae bacterium]